MHEFVLSPFYLIVLLGKMVKNRRFFYRHYVWCMTASYILYAFYLMKCLIREREHNYKMEEIDACLPAVLASWQISCKRPSLLLNMLSVMCYSRESGREITRQGKYLHRALKGWEGWRWKNVSKFFKYSIIFVKSDPENHLGGGLKSKNFCCRGSDLYKKWKNFWKKSWWLVGDRGTLNSISAEKIFSRPLLVYAPLPFPMYAIMMATYMLGLPGC